MIYLRESTNGDLAIVENEQDGVDKTYKLLEEGDYTVVGPKTITKNGKYEAKDDGYVGYSEVTVDVPTPTLQFRNFTYTSAGDVEEIFVRIPTYTNSGLETINATMLSADAWNLPIDFDEPDHVACKLPVIDGKCEFTFMCMSGAELEDGSHIGEASSGCTLTHLGNYGDTEYSVYKVSIDEDNAKLILHFEV